MKHLALSEVNVCEDNLAAAAAACAARFNPLSKVSEPGKSHKHYMS